jgi:hypothetical protein
MLVTKIYLAAMSRADVSVGTLASLPNFYFYVDEFQSFANQSFADILSEARKYKLNLIIAHQFIEQMEEEVRDAVFGNVGTTVCFRVGPFDAEVLETIFNPQFTATDLVNLGFAQVYLTLMIDGVGSPPFSATTLPPFDLPPERFVTQVVENSRKSFGKPRVEVEEAIKVWHEADTPPAPIKAAPRSTSAAPAKLAPVQHISPPPVQVSVQSQPMAATTVLPAAAAPAPRPRPASIPTPTKPKPPLEGALSLREALAQATGKKTDAPAAKPTPPKPVFIPPPPPKPQHNLKDTLRRIAPSAEAPKGGKMAEALPEDTLRSMLAVDESPGTP